MVRLDCLIFGYRRLTVKPLELSLFTSILLRSSIPSVIDNSGDIVVRERDFEKIKEKISGRIDFSYSEPLGLWGWWSRLSHKAVIIATVLICLILTLYLSGLVWDIRIEGNEKMSEAEILGVLEECGVEIGKRWSKIERSKTETELLDKCERVSWVNINRRGSVAYVKISERDSAEEKGESLYPASNIIASADCVIEEITVKRGVAAVKVGDTVRKGDILVFGCIPTEDGEISCDAEATVIGRVNSSLCVEIDRNYINKTKIEERIYSFSIKIFKTSINIFKRYGNLTKECDIIDDEIECSLLGRCPLPLSFTLSKLVEYNYEDLTYSDEELIEKATAELMELTGIALSNADLLKLRTKGEFTESGYRMINEIVYLTQVGAEYEQKQ